MSEHLRPGDPEYHDHVAGDHHAHPFSGPHSHGGVSALEGDSRIREQDLVEAAGGEQNVPAYLAMEAEQRERDFADDCGYPFATHMHPTESGKGKTWACPAAPAEVRATQTTRAGNDRSLAPSGEMAATRQHDARESLVSNLTRWIGQSGWVRDYQHARVEAEGFVRDFGQPETPACWEALVDCMKALNATDNPPVCALERAGAARCTPELVAAESPTADFCSWRSPSGQLCGRDMANHRRYGHRYELPR